MPLRTLAMALLLHRAKCMTQAPTRAIVWLTLTMLAPLLTGCELVGGIFKLGVWAGVLMVAVIVVLAYLASRFMRRT